MADSYKRYDGTERWDAIVIGSGAGGLAAAVLLGEHDRRVLVLEQHYVAGGFTHTFSRPGFDWDVGVHYIGDVENPNSPTRRLFDHVTGGSVQWAPMPDVYDRIILGDRTYDFVRGRAAFAARLIEYFPRERQAIERYLMEIKAVTRATGSFFTEKALPAPLAWLTGPLLRRKFLRLARRTTRETLEQWTDDQRLIAVLTGQFGDYGLPPGSSSFAIHAMVANHYMKGGFYPVGGAKVLADGAVGRIQQFGGRVLVNATVERIVVEGNRATGVEMSDGRVFHAPTVISDAGAKLTLGHLLRGVRGPVESLREKVGALSSSVGHLGLYIGLDKTDEQLGLEGTNLWIYPDEHHDTNFNRFANDPEAPIPLMFVSFPSSKDPAFASRHPGHSTIDVITLASWDWFSRWKDLPWKKRGAEYDALKDRFAQRLLEILFRHVPQAEAAISIVEISSPLSTRTFAAWERGELYGLDHTPARFEERGLRPRTPIRGLFLTGQDIATCGVTGALIGGALTAGVVLGRPVIRKILQG